jgi:hypothetical protein
MPASLLPVLSGTAAISATGGTKPPAVTASVDTGINYLTYPYIWGVDIKPSAGNTQLFFVPEIYYTKSESETWIANVSISPNPPPGEGEEFAGQYTLRYYYK